MKLRNVLLPAIAICASAVALAQSPFDGTWALNQSKSNLTGDMMHFQPAGAGMMKYSDSEESYTFKTDGSSFTTPDGMERTFKRVNGNTYESTDKRNGILLSSSTWKLSDDGKALMIESRGTKPNGEIFDNASTYKRIGGTQGLAGAWRSNSVNMSSPSMLTITSTGADGVALTISAEKATCDAKWDSKDYAAKGPTVPEGLTLALTKTGANSFKLVEKLKGKIIFIGNYVVSADGETMTNNGTDGQGKEPFTEVWDKQA